mmetsp:Transcript_72567/g.235804  ORF Transcript_72567/g.235804 Transcript_72567/m.235804 type:complete len:242 (-) Transcript_72567:486-1211(-)
MRRREQVHGILGELAASCRCKLQWDLVTEMLQVVFLVRRGIQDRAAPVVGPQRANDFLYGLRAVVGQPVQCQKMQGIETMEVWRARIGALMQEPFECTFLSAERGIVDGLVILLDDGLAIMLATLDDLRPIGYELCRMFGPEFRSDLPVYSEVQQHLKNVLAPETGSNVDCLELSLRAVRVLIPRFCVDVRPALQDAPHVVCAAFPVACLPDDCEVEQTTPGERVVLVEHDLVSRFVDIKG